jgi:hypothetical protein
VETSKSGFALAWRLALTGRQDPITWTARPTTLPDIGPIQAVARKQIESSLTPRSIFPLPLLVREAYWYGSLLVREAY